MPGAADGPDDPVPIPITGELDLHTFQPREVAAVINAYIDAAQAKGLRRIRVVHGKGTGTLRQSVHHLLRAHPAVGQIAAAGASSGGWGATWVELRPAPPDHP